jgi:serine/threonine protein kinase
MHQFPKRTEISEHVAPMIDAGYDPKFGGYIVTPLYKAGTLDQYLTSSATATLTMREVVNFADEILQGLSVVFARRRVMHFDIKPSNIALDHGHVRIIDWGLAAARSAVGEPPHGFSQWYAPPEQRNARGPNRNWRSPACDVRALGATMYHLITGRPPLWLEASQRGLLGLDGDIAQDRVADFLAMLAHDTPTPLDAFFALDNRWKREQLRGLSDLVAQWLHPDPHQRVLVRGTTDDAYSLARRDLIEVTTALAGHAASDLDRQVGRAAFPTAPNLLGHNGVRMAHPLAGTQSTMTGSVSL